MRSDGRVGRRRSPAKRVYGDNPYRGFESLSLRQSTLMRAFFVYKEALAKRQPRLIACRFIGQILQLHIFHMRLKHLSIRFHLQYRQGIPHRFHLSQAA